MRLGNTTTRILSFAFGDRFNEQTSLAVSGLARVCNVDTPCQLLNCFQLAMVSLLDFFLFIPSRVKSAIATLRVSWLYEWLIGSFHSISCQIGHCDSGVVAGVLSGFDAFIPSRVKSVIATWDALISDRPYKTFIPSRVKSVIATCPAFAE